MDDDLSKKKKELLKLLKERDERVKQYCGKYSRHGNSRVDD